jgi:hypothetical protein
VCVDANSLKDLVVTTTPLENNASPADDRHRREQYNMINREMQELNTIGVYIIQLHA